MKKIRMLCLAAAASLLTGGVFADTPLVVNGGFDDMKDGRTVGWQTVGTRYVYRDGVGRSGTRALYYTNDAPKFYSFPGQSIDLKPGRSYEYEVWIKTENLAGDESGATICIEWNGANGKWLGGAYAEGVKGTKDWTCVRGRTSTIPSNAKSFRVSPYVRKGMTGRAWFDDLVVREFHPEPLSGLFSTVYRNLAVDGDVTFKAALNATEIANRGGATAFFRYRDAQGVVQRRPAQNADGDSLTLPVAALAKGRQRVSVELVTAAGTRLGTAHLDFTRADRLPSRATWFDRHGRAIVQGRPYFPLGMYWSGITTNRVDLYAQGPFNCLMPYGAPNSRDLLDYCQAKGLMVIYSVKDIYAGTRWAPKGIDTAADEMAYIKDRVARFKNHPAILAWYLNDELPLTMLDRLTARRNLMEELDAGHPGWVVLYQQDQIAEYLPTFDVIGTDPYPIPDRPAAMATTWTRNTRKGTRGCKPLWQVPQAFNWGCYKKDPADRARMRAPTEAELRSMSWQCIANGANGLVFYSFFDLSKPSAGVPFETRWAECCRVGREIRDCFPILLADPAALSVRVDHAAIRADWNGPAEPVSWRAWEKDGEIYLLVVNAYDAPLDVSLTGGIADGSVAATPVFGPAPTVVPDAARGTRLTFALAALEPALVRLAPAARKRR